MNKQKISLIRSYSLIAIVAVLAGNMPLLTVGQEVETPEGDTEGDIIALSAFEVVGEKYDGYFASLSTGATRTQIANLDIPQTVVVITEEFMEDIAAFQLQDAIRYSINIQPRVNGLDRWRMRGHSVAQNYKNGYLDSANRAASLDPAFVERVEIIMGPNAVALGDVDPGGSVNVVMKRPLFEEFSGAVSLTADTATELLRSSFDVGGPLNSSKTMGFRFNAVYDKSNHWQTQAFVDGGEDDLPFERYAIYPQFGWIIGKKLHLQVDFEYNDMPRLFRFISVAAGDLDGDGIADYQYPFDWNFSAPWSNRQGRVRNLQAFLTYQLFDWLSFRQSVNWYKFDESEFRSNVGGFEEGYIRAAFPNNTGGEVPLVGGTQEWLGRNIFVIEGTGGNVSYQGDLAANFKTGPIKHHLVAGYAYTDTRPSTQSQRLDIGRYTLNLLRPELSIDARADEDPLRNANNWRQPPADSTTGDTGLFRWQRPATEDVPLRFDRVRAGGSNYSVYVQDRVSFWEDRLTIVLGTRFDRLQEQESDMQTNSPRIAGVFKLTPNVSLYGIRSKSNRPQFRIRKDPTRPPITDNLIGGIDEFGVKAELFNGRVSGTFAYFDNTRENLIVGIDQPDGTNDFETEGAQIAKGIEIGLGGYITDNWQFVFGAGTLDTENNSRVDRTTGSTQITQGLEMIGAIDYRVSMWTNYYITQGTLAGLSVGGGWIFNGRMNLDRATTVFAPESNVGELRFAYAFGEDKRQHISVNIQNITDEKFIIDAQQAQFQRPGAPRNFIFTFTSEW